MNQHNLSHNIHSSTKNNSDLWVVIAAYNEAQVIEQTILGVKEFIKNIIVVNDCSPDDTAIIAANAGAYVLTHPINLGQGAALQTGIDYALLQGAKYIVTFDADGQHAASEILPMLVALKAQDAEVCLGSRFMGSTKYISPSRKLLLKAALLYTRLTSSGIKITDVHNGFRILSNKFCRKFRFTQNRMAHASEILSYLAKNKINFIEHPVTITYTDYSVRKGQKGINSIRIMMEMAMRGISK